MWWCLRWNTPVHSHDINNNSSSQCYQVLLSFNCSTSCDRGSISWVFLITASCHQSISYSVGRENYLQHSINQGEAPMVWVLRFKCWDSVFWHCYWCWWGPDLLNHALETVDKGFVYILPLLVGFTWDWDPLPPFLPTLPSQYKYWKLPPHQHSPLMAATDCYWSFVWPPLTTIHNLIKQEHDKLAPPPLVWLTHWFSLFYAEDNTH